MSFYYLSFADDNGFLGATVVVADDFVGAIAKAHRLKINPGGEVMGYCLPPEVESRDEVAALLNNLLGRDEVLALGGAVYMDGEPAA